MAQTQFKDKAIRKETLDWRRIQRLRLHLAVCCQTKKVIILNKKIP